MFNRGREIWAEVPKLGVKKFTYRPGASAKDQRPVYLARGSRAGYLLLDLAIDHLDPSF